MAKRRSDREGAVYQTHTKDCPKPVDARGKSTCKCRWRGALIVGYKPNPNGSKPLPIRKTVSANTRTGAASRLQEMRDQDAANNLPAGKSPTVEQWLNYCASRLLPRQIAKGKFRKSSLATYKKNFRNYLIPLLGHVRLDQLTADHIEDAWQILAEVGNPRKGDKAEPLAPDTIHTAHVILVRCLRLAIQAKKLRLNPAGPDSMDAPSKGNGEAEPLATEDWHKVLDIVEGKPGAARWTVALALGLRQGESLGLRWEDLDLDEGTIRIRQQLIRLPGEGIVFTPPKSERSKRAIALPDEFLPELRAHRKAHAEARLQAGDHWQDHGLVFTQPDGRPIDPSVDRRRWHQVLEAAGVAPIKLHAARHTAATMMLLRGIDPRVVMDIMGWSQTSTAANYQHAVKEAQRGAAAAIGAAVWGR